MAFLPGCLTAAPRRGTTAGPGPHGATMAGTQTWASPQGAPAGAGKRVNKNNPRVWAHQHEALTEPDRRWGGRRGASRGLHAKRQLSARSPPRDRPLLRRAHADCVPILLRALWSPGTAGGVPRRPQEARGLPTSPLFPRPRTPRCCRARRGLRPPPPCTRPSRRERVVSTCPDAATRKVTF